MKLFVVLCCLLPVACAKPVYLSESPGTATSEKLRADGCVARFTPSNHCVDLKWESRPTESTYGSFLVTITDAATQNLIDITTGPDNGSGKGATHPLKVVLWMPSMGHGSAPVKVEKISTGLYRAKDVFFTMKGDWEIRFQIDADQAVYALFL